MTSFYYIDRYAPGRALPAVEAVARRLQNDYEPDAYVHVFEDSSAWGDEAPTVEIVYRGYAKDFVTPFERDYIDAATAALGSRFN